MAKPRTKKKKNVEPVEDDGFPGGIPAPVVRDDPFGLAADKVGKGWGTASEVLDVIQAVPTCFPDFNRATGVGGLPVSRITVVHGPSHGGKSIFVLGLIKSFLEHGYMGGYVDAEHATGLTFAMDTIGDLNRYPGFYATRPSSYEETIENVDEFLAKAAAKVEKYPNFRSIMVVDSINKLTPKRELSKMLKAGQVDKGGADEMAKGHQGRYRAQLNQAWLDHLTPKLAKAKCAMVVIAQERDDNDDFLGDSFKVKGGRALIFDSSLVIRVLKSAPVWINKSDKKNHLMYGFKHRLRIWKSKVGPMDGRYTDSLFHVSNGKLTAPGLDLARDLVHVGVEMGIIKTSGSWYSYGRVRGQGAHNMVKRIAEDQSLHQKLVDEIQSKMAIRT